MGALVPVLLTGDTRGGQSVKLAAIIMTLMALGTWTKILVGDTDAVIQNLIDSNHLK